MLAGEGVPRLPGSAAAWLAAFVVAMLVGGICLAVQAWIAISLRLPHFLQPSFEGVASNTFLHLHSYLLTGAGVLAGAVLLAVIPAVSTRLRSRERGSEMSPVAPDRLLTKAIPLVLTCVLLVGVGEVARWYGDTLLPDQRVSLVGLSPGDRLRFVSSGLFIGAGVAAALALAQAMSAVAQSMRSRNANSDSPPAHREDAGSIPDRVSLGTLSYWAVGFIVGTGAGYVCLWLGLREFWLGYLDLPAGPFPSRAESADLRPDFIEVTGQALRHLGGGLLAGAGVLVALAWLRSVRVVDRRPVGLLTGARSLVTGFGVLALGAGIVYWLIRSVILADPPEGARLVTEVDSIILFGWIVVWETEASEAMLSLVVRTLAYGLIVGTAVAAIPTLRQVQPHAQQRLGGTGADREANTPTPLAVAPGFIAALLAGGLCITLGPEILSLGREVVLPELPRSSGRVLIPIQSGLSTGLFIGAGVVAAAIVSLAFGALQRRVSERRSQDSPA